MIHLDPHSNSDTLTRTHHLLLPDDTSDVCKFRASGQLAGILPCHCRINEVPEHPIRSELIATPDIVARWVVGAVERLG